MSIQIQIQQRFNVFITTSVHKIVKHTSKILQELMQDFIVCLAILWTFRIKRYIDIDILIRSY